MREGVTVHEAVVAPLTTWENFYTIAGSAAAALTGLMFVVITLVAERRAQMALDDDGGGIAAFSTPTVVHYCVALGIAAILTAPWPALWPAALLLGLCGCGGVGYIVVVMRRMRRQASYNPVLEDWLWHVGFALVAYVALIGAAILLVAAPMTALFVVGAATVLLLLIGIHNAWDTVTYMVMQRSPSQVEEKE
jgi:hypothetical protein